MSIFRQGCHTNLKHQRARRVFNAETGQLPELRYITPLSQTRVVQEESLSPNYHAGWGNEVKQYLYHQLGTEMRFEFRAN
jgi:hypothetical protein